MEWVGHRNLPDRPPGSGILNSLEMSQRLVGSSGEIRRELVHNFRNNCLFVPRPLAVLSQRGTARRTGSADLYFLVIVGIAALLRERSGPFYVPPLEPSSSPKVV